MSQKITEFTEDVEVIQKLGDYPNSDQGLSADQLKEMFDRAPKKIKEFINAVVVPAVRALEDGMISPEEVQKITAKYIEENMPEAGYLSVRRNGSVAGEATFLYATSLEVVGSARYLEKVRVPVQVTETNAEIVVKITAGEDPFSPIATKRVAVASAGQLQVELDVGRWFAPDERIVIWVAENEGGQYLLYPTSGDNLSADWLRDTPGCKGWMDEETQMWAFDSTEVRFTGELIFYDTLREEMLQLEENAVSCKPQILTPEQQAQAMENIGAEHYYHAAREAFDKPIGEITTEYTLGLYDALMEQYPDKITKKEIRNDDGTFTNYEYVISSGQYNTEGIRGTLDTDIKKPKYLVMSGIHGREKAVMMSLYRFVRDVLSGHNVPSHFLESTEIHVVPCVNPYSIDTTDRYNANGVNINRNFDWEWNKSSLTGEHAASEKETQAIVNWLSANKDARLFLDLHNSGNPHEVAMVVGLKGNEAVNMAKRTSLQGLDRVIPFWRNVIKYEAHKVPVRAGTSDEKVEVREPVFSYSSYVEGASTGGLAIHYATGKLGITSLAMETTICANADCITSELEDLAKAYSAETIAVGADVIGNTLLEFYRQDAIVNDNPPDEESNDNTDPDRHAKFFTITDDGVVSLKPEYRSAPPDSKGEDVSDMGLNKFGSKFSEVPKHLIVPEIVDGKAVYKLATAIFRHQDVESVTLPSTITEVSDYCFDNCWHLKNVHNTENIKAVGKAAFQKSTITRLNFPSLEQISGIGAFINCRRLIYANIGNVTTLPDQTFNTCTALNMVKSNNSINSVGKKGFYTTFKLKHANLSGLKNAGEIAFLRSGVDFDPSMSTDGFGANATYLQYSPVDYWSACTFTQCENRLPTHLSQEDERWASREIGTSGVKYNYGCALFTMMHAYCGLHNISVSTVGELESVINGVDPTWLNSFSTKSNDKKPMAEKLGLKCAVYDDIDQAGVQVLYDALAAGKYGIVTYEEPQIGAHEVVVYGINAKGELLVADSWPAFLDDGRREPIKYTLPIYKLRAQASDENGLHYNALFIVSL